MINFIKFTRLGIFIFCFIIETYSRPLSIRKFWAASGYNEEIKGGFERWNGQLAVRIYIKSNSSNEYEDGYQGYDSLFYPITFVKNPYDLLHHFFSITQTFDANILLCGYVNSLPPYYNKDILVYKVTEWWEFKWGKRIATSYNEQSNFITQVEGVYQIYLGTEESQDTYGIIGKIDFNGNIIWSKKFGWGREKANFLIKEGENKYILIGETKSMNNSKDILLIQMDFNGNVEKTQILSTIKNENLQFLCPAKNNKWIGIGESDYFGNKDIILIEFDSLFHFLNAFSIGNIDVDETPRSIINTKDSAYVMAVLSIQGVDTASIITKMAQNYNIEWSKIINLTYPVIINSLIQSSKGDLVLMGKIKRNTDSDALIMNMSLQGNTCNETVDYPLSIDSLSMDTFSISLPIWDVYFDIFPYELPHFGFGVFSETICETQIAEKENHEDSLSIKIYQDGFLITSLCYDKCPIIVEIFDLLGRKIFEKYYKNSYFIKENLNLQPGIYFLNLNCFNSKNKKIKFLKIGG